MTRSLDSDFGFEQRWGNVGADTTKEISKKEVKGRKGSETNDIKSKTMQISGKVLDRNNADDKTHLDRESDGLGKTLGKENVTHVKIAGIGSGNSQMLVGSGNSETILSINTLSKQTGLSKSEPELSKLTGADMYSKLREKAMAELENIAKKSAIKDKTDK